MKVLITGSRTILDTFKIFNILKEELKERDIVLLGGALGVDNIAKTYWQMHNIKFIEVLPLFKSKKEYYLHRSE